MKPTTEHIITALRDGIALRTDLCERLGCENAALTKVIRNMLDRDLITRALQDGALAYYLTNKGRAWRPGMQSASVRAKARAKAKGGDSEGGEADVVTHNPHTGTRRDERDIASDPAGILIVEPGVPLRASPKAKNDEVSKPKQAQSDVEAQLYKWRAFAVRYACDTPNEVDKLFDNSQALIDKLQALLTSKEHECEALRAQLGEPHRAPALALHDHIYAVAAALYDGQNIAIGKESLVVQSQCRNFRCKPQDVKSVLDASAMLARLEAA